MRRRPPGLSVGLATSLRSMPTAYCEVSKSSSTEVDIGISCEASGTDKKNLPESKIGVMMRTGRGLFGKSQLCPFLA
jgi:hypothetical protein